MPSKLYKSSVPRGSRGVRYISDMKINPDRRFVMVNCRRKIKKVVLETHEKVD